MPFATLLTALPTQLTPFLMPPAIPPTISLPQLTAEEATFLIPPQMDDATLPMAEAALEIPFLMAFTPFENTEVTLFQIFVTPSRNPSQFFQRAVSPRPMPPTAATAIPAGPARPASAVPADARKPPAELATPARAVPAPAARPDTVVPTEPSKPESVVPTVPAIPPSEEPIDDTIPERLPPKPPIFDTTPESSPPRFDRIPPPLEPRLPSFEMMPEIPSPRPPILEVSPEIRLPNFDTICPPSALPIFDRKFPMLDSRPPPFSVPRTLPRFCIVFPRFPMVFFMEPSLSTRPVTVLTVSPTLLMPLPRLFRKSELKVSPRLRIAFPRELV